jgi:type IV pilus assembly protein PilE
MAKLLQHSARHGTGFSLVEIMVVLVLLAILLSVAMPSYQQHFFRAWRLEAVTDMYRIADLQWQFRLEQHRFSDDFAELGVDSQSRSGLYRFRLLRGDDYFVIEAKAQNRALQDLDCQTLTFRSDGRWQSVPSNACWGEARR